uniref:Putative secreted protein n=1 Tax=Anopheles triannulatus TaxID=58253 RepID=A0A2M4B6Z9_9DIPT
MSKWMHEGSFLVSTFLLATPPENNPATIMSKTATTTIRDINVFPFSTSFTRGFVDGLGGVGMRSEMNGMLSFKEGVRCRLVMTGVDCRIRCTKSCCSLSLSSVNSNSLSDVSSSSVSC